METPSHVPPAHFHFLTPFYDVANELLGLGRRFRRAVIEALELEGTERLLDAGCGTGSLLLDLLAGYPKLRASGVDPDDKALELAKNKLSERGVPLHQARMEELPFETGSFDVVVTTLAIHHIPIDRRAASLAECARVLRPGGRILAADFGPDGAGPAARAVVAFLGLFEAVGENARLPLLLSQAGFDDVRLAGRRHLAAFHAGVRRS